MQALKFLIAEAQALANNDPCAEDHDWQQEGNRGCPTGSQNCGQPVFRCARCGEYDYGDTADGPGMIECRAACGDSMTGWDSHEFVA